MQIKIITGLLVFSACWLNCLAQSVWADHSRLLPDKLRGIQSGILVDHSPTPVYPELNADTINYPGKYIWKHMTTVCSTNSDLTVIEAGSYIWRGEKGWTANIRLGRSEFAARFGCKDGMLRAGQRYTFVKNWRFDDVVYPGDALWFVIAKDAGNRLFKGIALVETEDLANKPIPGASPVQH